MKKLILLILLLPCVVYGYDANTLHLWTFEGSNGNDVVNQCTGTAVGSMSYGSGLLAGSSVSAGIFTSGRLYTSPYLVKAASKTLQFYFAWWDTTQTNRYVVCDNALNLYLYAQSGQVRAKASPPALRRISSVPVTIFPH